MTNGHHIIIAGAGGIAQAAGLIIAHWSKDTNHIYIGNRTLGKAQSLVQEISQGENSQSKLEAFQLDGQNPPVREEIFKQAEILLDCLPGSEAPRMAKLAREYHLHYVNLTEYVAETEEIKKIAADSDKGFILQSGLAPGYIGILAHGLFLRFCQEYQVDRVDELVMKVGALTDHAIAPHYYGFTWSPVGVATEYLKDAEVLRDYKKCSLPSLSEKSEIIIDSILYEDNLTSGGAADIPDALEGKVRNLDYKTLRHPGHYDWIKSILQKMDYDPHPVNLLQEKMEENIPHLENDRIILYAAVQGKDNEGILRRKEVAKKILPQQIGGHRLRAIQSTTAAPMIQAAWYLLKKKPEGIILQSQLDPFSFLDGDFILPVYGSSGLNNS